MARPAYPSDNVDKLLLRFPPGMRDKLKALADANGRSMNAEVIHRLEKSFDEDLPPEEFEHDIVLALGGSIENRIVEFLTSERFMKVLAARMLETMAKDAEIATDAKSDDNG